MFTGIVTELGTVSDVRPTDAGRRITFEAPLSIEGMTLGDSIAVNGVCLTAVDLGADRITVDVVQESLDRSNLGSLEPGDRIDLERPMAAGGRFDGHIVQGHVDGVGIVHTIASEGEARRIRVELPDTLTPYVVEKGSITMDGVSLTVTGVSEPGERPGWFEVVLIPHTLEVTVLGQRPPGSKVNLEADVLAKYVERLLEVRT